jgi:homospermidine synthase
MRALGLHIQREKANKQKGFAWKKLYLTCIHVLIRKYKHNKKPTIVDGFTAFYCQPTLNE